MDLRRYSHVVALAEELHFGRAAERVNLSQPAFSRSIQAAEADVGMALFERQGAQVRCTPAGLFLADRARRLLQEHKRFSRDAALYRDKQMGDLVFGMGRFAAATFLPPLLQRMRASYPGVRIRAQAANLLRLGTLLRQEEIDFFVADTRQMTGDPAIDIEPLGRLNVAFYVRSGHPLIGRQPLRLEDLGSYGLATGRMPPQVQQLMAGTLGLSSPEALPIAVECDDTLALKAIMLATDTVMVGAPALVAAELAAGSVVPLQPEDLEPVFSQIGIVSLHGRSFSPIALVATQVVREIAVRATQPLG